MMILEIRLENFFSIKDEILLDFRAAKINTRGARELPANVIDYKGEKILKSIGLFGANASGKSNILKAIKSCSEVILDSHQYNEGKVFGFVPFKLKGYSDKLSRFSIDFIHDDVEYEYSFALTAKAIQQESLYYYPNGRRAKVFTRDETKGTSKTEVYSFTDGAIPRPFDVATSTSRKTLFLSRASQMDRELCRKLYCFFMYDFLLDSVPVDSKWIKQSFAKYRELILHALSICDSDISGIKLISENNILIRVDTFHKHSPSIPFDLFSEESNGTNQLFGMLFLLLDVVKNGRALMLDEFDLSLHTKLAEFVIDLFHAGSQAQFLFASHNTSLIDIKRFRRDQIVFVNKKDDGSTELYSLYDHKDFRENMDAEKGYLQGRFDAIPLADSSLAALKKLLEDGEPQ
ncbi:MAG: ATP-binding protein [Treponema sp.]|jgi:AAA15 family ATPase/GTPase|nr:ATP-binding protein [Treponema sp.]